MRGGEEQTFFHAEGLSSPAWFLDYLHFSEGLEGEKNNFSQDAARSRSEKGRYQGHRGQRSRSFCNFIGQKGTHSTIYDLFVLK